MTKLTRGLTTAAPPMMALSSKASDALSSAASAKIHAPLAMPPRLSPTAATAFNECQQLFLFRNMWKLPEPPSKVLVKGSLVHDTLDAFFDLAPSDRSIDVLHDTLRGKWRRMRKQRQNLGLFSSREEERQWGLECLHLLDNYAAVENFVELPQGEPVAREAWMKHELAAAATAGLPTLKLVGRIDRLDSADEGIIIVDYKTGKAPKLKSAAADARVREKNFFQLWCYALMLARGPTPKLSSPAASLRPQVLRLLYLGDGEDGGATAVEEELPREPEQLDSILDAVSTELVDIWSEIHNLVLEGDPTQFKHCDRPFCFCHEARPLVFK